MKKILQYLFEHKTLSREQAKEVLTNIGKGIYNEHEVTAFMTVFLMRSITIEELQGFRDALLELCVAIDLNGLEVIDIVGTGGDGKNTCHANIFQYAWANGKSRQSKVPVSRSVQS